jgi:hypothetical protein
MLTMLHAFKIFRNRNTLVLLNFSWENLLPARIKKFKQILKTMLGNRGKVVKLRLWRLRRKLTTGRHKLS